MYANIDRRISDPFETLSQMRNEINRLFGESGSTYPVMNLWTNDKGAVVTAEIPGVEAEGLDISVDGDLFTVKGTRTAVEPKKETVLFRAECPSGTFQRFIKLPFRIDHDHIDAKCSRGVLTVTLPRAKEDLPRKIQVKAAS